MLLIIAALAQAASVQSKPKIKFQEPPIARESSGAIDAVLLAPLFREAFVCSEHHSGQMPHAGDALGTDCMVFGGIGADGTGFATLYRTDGRANQDWYGWGVDVLSPIDGSVTGLFPNLTVNEPGKRGRPPAGMLQIEADDGTIVILAHVTDVRVAPGDRVKAGQAIARVGNNGPSRAPHVHVGAYRGDVPFQIRWDQRAMARYRRASK